MAVLWGRAPFQGNPKQDGNAAAGIMMPGTPGERCLRHRTQCIAAARALAAGRGGRYLAPMRGALTVLGIETSCDETAVAVVGDAPVPSIRANVIHSQIAEHAPHGGVVPEIAARAHLVHIEGLVRRALAAAEIGLDALDGIAAAAGPGLIGGLAVGAMVAKGLAWGAGKPFVAVNHLEAHALTARLVPGVEFPYLLLLVSGGHTQLVACAGVGRYRQLGTSRDDAAGEAFDKTAKLLGLGYPGGPAIERAARDGDPRRFALPRPLRGRAGCEFSFSGLKTAVRHIVADMDARAGPIGPQDVCDLAAAVEMAICDTLVDRTANAIAWFRREYPRGTALVAAGGVAANAMLRRRLAELATTAGLDFVAPPPALCTDNGAMVAWAGLERLRLGLSDGLDTPLRPRWPLDDPGSGAER
jgi:N6-L-threonylcarbamoyladenine synthase